ncbi:MAG TPA: DUF4870 domain-containing protein [Povalibacter sp.]|nr:DUF4870 domain-containing protein [Povalibacter sp.]
MNQVTPSTPSAEERNWAVICHLSALAGLVVWGIGIILGPLIVWLVKKDTLPFVSDQGKEALNFQITVFLAGVVCTALVFLLIGVPMLAALAVFDLVFIIIAAVKASEGVQYRYPIALRLIK